MEYEEIIEGGTATVYNYVHAPTGLCAIYEVDKATGNSGTLWHINTDHLGSITYMEDASDDSNTKEFSFTAWGISRNPTNWSQLSSNPIFADRGFTGHEHLSEFNLINMNGRVYDPVLARFLSPDPYVQMPGMRSGFNRYSYCLNNPLIYTDPSGEFIFTTLAAFFAPPLLPIAILADVGMYAGGSIQQGTINPIDWDYSDRDLYKAMAVGGIVGGGIGAGGMYLANLAWGVGSTAMSLPSWGTISSALAYGNANMAQTVLASFGSPTSLTLDAVFRSGITGMALGSFSAGDPVAFLELVTVNNIKENTDFIDGDALELHIGPFGYDFDKTEGGFYTMFDKGLSFNERLDMGMESLYLLSFIPNDPLTSREIRSPFKTRVRQSNMGNPYSIARYNKLNEYSTIFDFRTYQGQETMESIRQWSYKLYVWYYHTFGKE